MNPQTRLLSLESQAERFVATGIMYYGRQQMIRAIKDCAAYPTLGGLIIAQPHVLPDTRVAAALAITAVALVVIEWLVVEGYMDSLKRSAACAFTAADRFYFWASSPGIPGPIPLGTIRAAGRVIANWYAGLSTVPDEIKPIIGAIHECVFRVTEHSLARAFSVGAFCLALLPTVVAYFYGIIWADLFMNYLCPSSTVYFVTILAARRHHRALRDSRHLLRHAVDVANAWREGGLSKEAIEKNAHEIAAQLSKLRHEHAPVCRFIYRFLRDENNRKCEWVARVTRAGEPIDADSLIGPD